MRVRHEVTGLIDVQVVKAVRDPVCGGVRIAVV